MSILFINGSPNKNGNTAALAQILLKGKEYETLNLTEYKVYSYGHKFEDDQLSEIIAKMLSAMYLTVSMGGYSRMNFQAKKCIFCFRAQLLKNG